jgi:hypothetical protein
MANLIAFAGYAREGKDAAATRLINLGWKRLAFGDIIKRQIDGLVQQHLGFSAFTESDPQKQQIRPILEQWGEVNYDGVMKEFFDSLPPYAVNTRLVRLREAKEWIKRGGVILRIRRPGVEPATEWERTRLQELYDSGVIHDTILNDSSLDVLWDRVGCFAAVGDTYLQTR